MCKQAQQLENLVMEAEQEDFNKSVENLTKHCNAYVPCLINSGGHSDSCMIALMFAAIEIHVASVYVSCREFLLFSSSIHIFQFVGSRVKQLIIDEVVTAGL